MGIKTNDEDLQRIRAKLSGFFDGFEPELQAAGEQAREAIVQTTLAGIGEADQPFKPYSAAYAEQIAAVGGKPQGTVNLRGVFAKKEAKAPKNPKGGQLAWERRQLAKGALRRAYVSVKFKGREFTARTGTTRAQRGLNDPESEMSIDLIKVEVGALVLRLVYTPRESPHMIYHQEGEGKNPKRTWFTFNKVAVRAAMFDVVRTGIAARVAWFNSHDGPG